MRLITMHQKTRLAPGGERDGAEEEKAKEEEEKEVRTTSIGDRNSAHGRNAKINRDTQSRTVQSQDRDTRSSAGRSARTTIAVIARERAVIRETADIANVEEEAKDGKEVEGAVAETIRGKTISDGTIEGTVGRNIAGTNGGETIGATIE